MPSSALSHEQPRRSRLRWFIAFGVVAVLLLTLLLVGWLPRTRRDRETKNLAKQQETALPDVQVLKIERARSAGELQVPGTTQAFTEANIYARASGYVRRRLVDIGDRVHQGQLLATIDAPDLDQQVAQGRAEVQQSQSTLNQLEAQLHLADVTWNRWKVLVAKGVFSRQDGDTQEANYRVAEANVRAARNTVRSNEANLERLIVLQQYERVMAPFDGVITARNIDVGAFIGAQGAGLTASSQAGGTQAATQSNAGGSTSMPANNATPATGGSQGGQMFSMARTDPLRIFVSTPQSYADAIRVGQRAQIHFQEFPKKNLEARVTRTSASIDQNTRTLLVEIQLPNRESRLMAGMYVIVSFLQASSERPLLAPGDALAVRNAKTVVALVKNNIVHYQPVEIGRDYGDETEITDGLNEGDLIATNISDDVPDGARIKPRLIKLAPEALGGQSDQKPGGQAQYGNQGLSDQTKGSSPGGKSGKKNGSGK